MRYRTAAPMLAGLSLMLAACGGDGGMGMANSPPVFSSASTATTAENATATVHTATASDPDGGSLTFSISGGAATTRDATRANDIMQLLLVF